MRGFAPSANLALPGGMLRRGVGGVGETLWTRRRGRYGGEAGDALEASGAGMEDILDAVPGSFLEEYDALNVEVSFQSAVSVSAAYALMYRCNLEPDEHFRHDDFLSVFDFNTAAVVFALGHAVSESAEQALREIEKAVKSYGRVRIPSGVRRL